MLNKFLFFPFRYFGPLFIFCLVSITIVLANIDTRLAWLFVPVFIYLVPPLSFRLFIALGFPQFKNDLMLLDKKSAFGSDTFKVWWISNQLQLIYLRFPALEEVLKIVPGLYSAWLRLWGAKIGKDIVWTPQLTIMDRPFMSIGDYALIGTGTRMTSHLVNRNDPKDPMSVTLFLASFTIGESATVGGFSSIGPGCQVDTGELVKPLSVVKNGIFFKSENS